MFHQKSKMQTPVPANPTSVASSPELSNKTSAPFSLGVADPEPPGKADEVNPNSHLLPSGYIT
jgi:hypothetical protein